MRRVFPWLALAGGCAPEWADSIEVVVTTHPVLVGVGCPQGCEPAPVERRDVVLWSPEGRPEVDETVWFEVVQYRVDYALQDATMDTPPYLAEAIEPVRMTLGQKTTPVFDFAPAGPAQQDWFALHHLTGEPVPGTGILTLAGTDTDGRLVQLDTTFGVVFQPGAP